MNILDDMEAALRDIARTEEYGNPDFMLHYRRKRATETLREYEAVKDRVVVVPVEPTASMGIAWNIAAKDTASYFSTEYYRAMIQAAQEGE